MTRWLPPDSVILKMCTVFAISNGITLWAILCTCSCCVCAITLPQLNRRRTAIDVTQKRFWYEYFPIRFPSDLMIHRAVSVVLEALLTIHIGDNPTAS